MVRTLNGEEGWTNQEFARECARREGLGLWIRGNTKPHAPLIKSWGGIFQRHYTAWLLPTPAAVEKAVHTLRGVVHWHPPGWVGKAQKVRPTLRNTEKYMRQQAAEAQQRVAAACQPIPIGFGFSPLLPPPLSSQVNDQPTPVQPDPSQLVQRLAEQTKMPR